MGVFKLGKMTFGSLFKKPETVMYPIEKKPQPLGLKGHIVVKEELCILCGMCEKGCPTDCITVDKEASEWRIQPLQCIQCGYCTRICPKSCLVMDPNYWSATTAKDVNRFAIPQKEKTAAKPAKEAKAEPKAEKVDIKPEVVEEPDQAAVDGELEAKIALMDPEKADRVRKALANR
ncbi:MAG: 4Fe-4S binding protein [Eggerthellaceae bacterium]|nr:4Fe-4S binding protein [Eggerthellaceae bacterium]